VSAFAPELALVPPAPSPLDLEEEARAELLRLLRLNVRVRAPEWREILFGGRPISAKLPVVPPAVLARIEKAEATGPARRLLGIVQREMPETSNPRTIAASRPLPPPKDAMAAWLRLIFLVTAGPSALRLLVAAGYLTGGDIDIMQDAYPAGLDQERTASVEAAMALTSAAMRNRQDPDVPNWLNDQLLTLMDEHRPIEFFAGLYEADAQPQQGPSAGSGQSVIAQQNKPIVNVGGPQ